MKLFFIYQGDCIKILRKEFEDKSVDFVITSPPFKTYKRGVDREEDRGC